MDTGKPPRGRRSTVATSRGGAGDDDERLHASSTVRAGELDFGVSGEGAETKARNSASSRTSIRGSGRGATLGSGGWLLRLGEAGRAIPEHVCKNTRSVCVCAYMCVLVVSRASEGEFHTGGGADVSSTKTWLESAGEIGQRCVCHRALFVRACLCSWHVSFPPGARHRGVMFSFPSQPRD